MEKVTPQRELEYTPEFKQLIHENRGLLLTVFNAIQHDYRTKYHVYRRFDEGDIESPELQAAGVDVHRFESYEDEDFKNTSTYKVDAGEKSYFVKRLKQSGLWQGDGFSEFQASKEVEERIKDLTKVRVVNYMLGYTKGRETSYFVSEWDDALGKKIYEVLNELKEKWKELPDESEEKEEVRQRFNDLNDRIREILDLLRSDFLDVDVQNMGYDEETDTVVLFDLLNKKDFPINPAAFEARNPVNFHYEQL